MPRQDTLLARTAVVVRIASLANHAFLVAAVVGILGSWLSPGLFSDGLLRTIPPADLPSALTGARLLLLIGIAMSLATDRLLRALSEMIASARLGDPFVARNADRLRTIGWCLLGLQLLEVPAALLRTFFPGMGAAAPSGDLSIAGWMAALMVFALSRVYRVGTAMRDDLDGTV